MEHLGVVINKTAFVEYIKDDTSRKYIVFLRHTTWDHRLVHEQEADRGAQSFSLVCFLKRSKCRREWAPVYELGMA